MKDQNNIPDTVFRLYALKDEGYYTHFFNERPSDKILKDHNIIMDNLLSLDVFIREIIPFLRQYDLYKDEYCGFYDTKTKILSGSFIARGLDNLLKLLPFDRENAYTDSGFFVLLDIKEANGYS